MSSRRADRRRGATPTEARQGLRELEAELVQVAAVAVAMTERVKALLAGHAGAEPADA